MCVCVCEEQLVRIQKEMNRKKNNFKCRQSNSAYFHRRMKKQSIASSPLFTFQFYFYFCSAEESTETPGEWILIPSVTPASTPPSILVAAPITGVITKRPLPTTASPMRNHTTPFAHSSTASRPKPTSRPPPPLPPSSFEPGNNIRWHIQWK